MGAGNLFIANETLSIRLSLHPKKKTGIYPHAIIVTKCPKDISEIEDKSELTFVH